jgi:protein-L-isoaspartate(D-aspartate) O-methyltransferase
LSAALQDVRTRYAEQITASLPEGDPRDAIRAAFATVPREAFLGTPPWYAASAWPGPDRRITKAAGAYRDVLIQLDKAKGINNGSPSLHARMLYLLGVRPGDRALHLGAGTGYYTAVLAELVGPAGFVVAVEFDAALAEAARANLRPWPQARALRGDAADWPREPAERIYVNFAAAEPAPSWLEHLTAEGTLLFPLGVPEPAFRRAANGALLLVTRTPGGFAARFDLPVAFIFAEGATGGDEAVRAALREAFAEGGADRVQSLLPGPGDPSRCWMTSARYSLSYDPP